jgi:hypothetical protein
MTSLLNALDNGDVKAIRSYLEANKNPETMVLCFLAAIGGEASTSTLKAIIKFILDYHETHPWSIEAITRQIDALKYNRYAELIPLYTDVWSELKPGSDLDSFTDTI